MAEVLGLKAHAALRLGVGPQPEAAAVNLEGSEQMSHMNLARGRFSPLYADSSAVRQPFGQLKVALAEAEAEQRQVQDRAPRNNVAGAACPVLRGGDHEGVEEGVAILHEILAEGPEAAESSAVAALESRAEHGTDLGHFSFERDWQVTALRAAAVGAGRDKVVEGCVAAAERRAHLRGGADTEATAHFHTTLRSKKEGLRTRLLQDVHAGDQPMRQQMARAEMEVLAGSCEGAVQHEEFDLEQSTALKLAQDRELVATQVNKQEQEMMRQRAESNKMRYQAEHEAGGRSGIIAAEGRGSHDGDELSMAHSEQTEGHLCSLDAQRRVPCFERDWRIKEVPADGASFDEELCNVLTKQPTKPLSQHEVQALQQWLVAVNATADANTLGADHGLAMARQTVERHADDRLSRRSMVGCNMGELADPEGLRAQLAAATGGPPLPSATA